MLVNISDLIVGIAVENVLISGVIVESLIALVPQIPRNVPQLFDKFRGPPFARFVGPDVRPVLFLFKVPHKWYPAFNEAVSTDGAKIIKQVSRGNQ